MYFAGPPQAMSKRQLQAAPQLGGAGNQSVTVPDAPAVVEVRVIQRFYGVSGEFTVV